MSWSMLSPMQWAKWTWSAVRGGGEEDEEDEEGRQGEEGGPKEEVFSRDEEKSPGGSSDSEGHFETPEALTPVHSQDRAEGELEESGDTEPASKLENVLQLISNSSMPSKTSLDENSNPHELSVAPLTRSMGDMGIADQGEVTNVLSNETSLDVAAGLAVPITSMPPADPEPSQVSTSQVASDEQLCNGHAEVQAHTGSKVKASKARPPSLNVAGTLNELSHTEVEDKIPVSKASYNFDPDLYDDNVNPFTSGTSKVQNSPPPTSASMSVSEVPEDSGSKPVVMEFGVADDRESKARKAPPQRKLGKKPGTKLTPKKQKVKPEEPGPKADPEPDPSSSLDDDSNSKTTYSFQTSQWEDPNFNPFGGSSKMSSSPVLPKGSYTFNPDNFEDSKDPFEPSKSLPEEALTMLGSPAARNNEELVNRKTEVPVEDELKGTESPKKNKGRMITGACKVKKYENQALVLDVCAQEDEPVGSHTPDIAHRVAHATDEEKLASTSTSQKPVKTAKEEEQASEEPKVEPTGSPEDKGTCPTDVEPSNTTGLPEMGGRGQEKGSPVLDSICISETDKAAVLTLIREEIITKEIEALEWKRKYEESRQEVMEMRKIVAEYEKTIAQMIEDEQRRNAGSQRTIQQLTMERDQALADLNSVERSLSDLFRRYENMKVVLEGFKKNEEVLKKCAQEYLARVKQEEHRYQTLKIHAEEKLDRANEEIAQVRAKANSESVALHAGLRKEQMRVESLERALDQKNQEIEELTKICDELIAKLGKVE